MIQYGMWRLVAAIVSNAATGVAAGAVAAQATPWSIGSLVFCGMMGTYNIVFLLISYAKS